tara:strand:+ start:1276 stop:1698 length:423 start_codon:yes stop_codon:yes gene_type:complete
MKKILLSVLCGLLFSVSFGQNKSSMLKKPILKQNSVKVVEHLNANLKLDEKQKAIVMNAFAEYADNMTKAIKKTSREVKSPSDVDPRDNRKAMHKYMMRFASERDAKIKECLKKRQVVQYDNVVKSIHPFTLDIRSKKKK